MFLARGLDEVPVGQRHIPTAEERDMPMVWVDLDMAADAAEQGRMHNAMAVASVLAAARARDAGLAQPARRGCALAGAQRALLRRALSRVTSG